MRFLDPRLPFLIPYWPFKKCPPPHNNKTCYNHDYFSLGCLFRAEDGKQVQGKKGGRGMRMEEDPRKFKVKDCQTCPCSECVVV